MNTQKTWQEKMQGVETSEGQPVALPMDYTEDLQHIRESVAEEINANHVEQRDTAPRKSLPAHAASYSDLPPPELTNLDACVKLAESNSRLQNELNLANVQKEQNWQAYQEALRLLDKAEAKATHAERLAEALRKVMGEFVTKESFPAWKDGESNDEFIRLADVETLAREALAAWEGAKS